VSESTDHIPVLLGEVLAQLARPECRRFADVTLGAGGHSEALLQAMPEAACFGLDRDPQALKLAGARLAAFGERVELHLAPFDQLPIESGPFDAILGDLGCSSMQLDQAARGFSFGQDGPLDMRMGPDAARSAAEIVNEASEEELTRILYEYGEEAAGRKVAAAIVRARKLAPIETTAELARIVKPVARSPRRRNGRPGIHPATRTFQGLRIAVNDELGCIDRALPRFLESLAPGGRLGIISFHSLEDRPVKRRFAAWKKAGLVRLLHKGVISASPEEIAANPRSRSARLRVLERLESP